VTTSVHTVAAVYRQLIHISEICNIVRVGSTLCSSVTGCSSSLYASSFDTYSTHTSRSILQTALVCTTCPAELCTYIADASGTPQMQRRVAGQCRLLKLHQGHPVSSVAAKLHFDQKFSVRQIAVHEHH
jgi:hypothetical protein